MLSFGGSGSYAMCLEMWTIHKLGSQLPLCDQGSSRNNDGVSRSVFFHHIETKELLVSGLFEDGGDSLTPVSVPAPMNPKPHHPPQRLKTRKLYHRIARTLDGTKQTPETQQHHLDILSDSWL